MCRISVAWGYRHPAGIDSRIALRCIRATSLNRHRAEAGKPGKTEFPASWNDDKILKEVSDVATDPAAVRGVGK